MCPGLRRIQICFGLTAGILLLVLLGLSGGLRTAAMASAAQSSLPGVSAIQQSPAERGLFSSSSTVPEMAMLPLIMNNILSDNRLTVWVESSRAPMIRALAAVSVQKHDVQLIVTEVDNIQEAILNADLLGQGPDLFVGSHDRLGSYLQVGALVPVNLGTKSEQFVKVALDGFTSNQETFGLPYAYENMGLFRNTDLVPAAPRTWETLLEDGQALQASGQISFTLALEGNGYKLYPIATTFGGYVFGRQNDGTWITTSLGISGTGMIAAGDWISEAVAAASIPPVAHGANGAETLFETGQVPFILTGPWALDRFRNAGIDYAISAFPDDGQPFVGVYGFMISTHSARQALAQEYLTHFVATSEMMKLLHQYEQRLPAYKPLAGSLGDPDLKALIVAGHGGEPIPAVPEMGCVWSPWDAAMTGIITQAQKPDEALKQAAEAIWPCLGGEYKGMINVPGTYQMLVGCQRDWDAACLTTAMTQTNGLYTAAHTLPAGDYLVKVAHDGSWEKNYGLDGVRDGANISFNVPKPGLVIFTYDPLTHILGIDVPS